MNPHFVGPLLVSNPRASPGPETVFRTPPQAARYLIRINGSIAQAIQDKFNLLNTAWVRLKRDGKKSNVEGSYVFLQVESDLGSKEWTVINVLIPVKNGKLDLYEIKVEIDRGYRERPI